jgi:hypothetical protein
VVVVSSPSGWVVKGPVVWGVAVAAFPCIAVSPVWAVGWLGLGSRSLGEMARWCGLCWRGKVICVVAVEEEEGLGVSAAFVRPWEWAPQPRD